MTPEYSSSQRQIRFGELIRSLISECLLRSDFYHTEISITSITVSFVRMSKDLRIANIYFMPLGGDNQKKLLDALNNNKYVFQKYIATSKLQSKFTPKINFYIDNTFDEAEKISKLLTDKKVSRDLKNEK
jgi:ribosome-binding factor A